MHVKAAAILGVCTLGWIAAASGCGGHDDPPQTASSGLTYWGDAAPIMFDKCVTCHQAGGIAPFALDSFAAAKLHATAVGLAVSQGDMPPYYIDHDGSCGDFDASKALTAAEKQTILGWIGGGLAEGTPAALTTPARPALEGGVDFKTPLFAPVPLGTKIAENDDYRCFLIDPGISADAFITGYDVAPSDPAIVHHVIGMVVDPNAPSHAGKNNAARMQELDDQSPDILGWDCFGGAGDGIQESASPVDWAPGQGVVAYPAGMGVRIKKTDRLVVQIHYNLADPTLRGRMDSTTVRLRFADQVERQLAFVLPDPFLNSLQDPTPESLAPGQSSVKYTWKRSLAEIGLSPELGYGDLVAVMPHMHGRGRSLEMQLGPGPGSPMTCSARTTRWDFHWQKAYFYKTPVRLTPETQIQVTCDYDTSKDTAPVLPGWGTKNEMCLSLLMVALPPGK